MAVLGFLGESGEIQICCADLVVLLEVAGCGGDVCGSLLMELLNSLVAHCETQNVSVVPAGQNLAGRSVPAGQYLTA